MPSRHTHSTHTREVPDADVIAAANTSLTSSPGRGGDTGTRSPLQRTSGDVRPSAHFEISTALDKIGTSKSHKTIHTYMHAYMHS